MESSNFLIAVTAVLTRQKLARYKQNAGWFYLGFVGVVMALNVVYTFAVLGALSTASTQALQVSMSDAAADILGSVIGAAVYIPLNYIYFKKRKELFVH